MSNADAGTRRKTLAPLLGDATRLVRIEAARALAGEAEGDLQPAERARFEKALKNYVDAQLFNAERPESHANLGALYAALGELARSQGDEAGVEAALRKALVANPSAGALHHALRLSLIRQGRIHEALSELAEAAKQAPAVSLAEP